MYFSNYCNNYIYSILSASFNMFNVNKSVNIEKVLIISKVNTFKSEKDVRIVHIFKTLFLVTNQRPFMKKFKFVNIRKQVLRSFCLYVTLRRYALENFMMYLVNHYIYFYNIYYKAGLKYNYNPNSFIYHIDNIQSTLRKEGRQSFKSQLKVIFFKDIASSGQFYKYLNSQNLLQITTSKNEISFN